MIAPVPVRAAGAGDYAKIVLGMANGIVGSAILLKCKLGTSQPSITVYFAGSLVYMAAEILGGKTKGGDVKANAQYMDSLKASMKEGGDYQKASIDIQIKNEKDNLKHIQKKKAWMQATVAVYGLAAALAVVEFILHFPPPPAGPGILKPDIAGCSPDGVSHKPAEKGIVMAYVAANGYANGGLMGAGLAVATPYILKLLGLVEVGTAATDAAVSMLNVALGRIAYFGAATALVGVVVGELSKEETRSKNIIAELEKVKGTFEGADNNIIEGTATSGAGGELANANGGTSQNAFAVAPLPPGTVLPKHCFSTAGNVANYSEASCAAPVKITKPVLHGNFNIPTLQEGISSTTDFAQAVADGDTGRANIEAQKLANLSGRIDAVRKDLFKKADDILKSQGKKPIDINGELKRQVAAINSELNKKEPGSGNLALEDLKAPTPSVDNALVASVGNVTPSESQKPEAEAFKMSEPTLPSSTEGTDNGVGGVSSESAVVSSGDAKNEINADPDVSLFKQVSMRYFLNYDKLFNRKKVDPPLLPAEEGATATE